MDLRQLEMVLAVADNAGFTLASRELHVSQSAISRKVRLLEEELGEKVFERASRKILITPAGHVLLRYTRKIFQDLRNASLEISEISSLARGQFRIGAAMIACTYLLPPVLERFKALHPRVELEVVTGPTETLLPKLRDYSIELGIFTLPISQPEFEVIPLRTEEMVVVTSKRHPMLSHKRWVTPEELAKYPLILFSKPTHTRRVLEHFFQEAAIAPRIAMEAEHESMIIPLVRMDLGISIMPLRAVAEAVKAKTLHYLRIRNHKLSLQIGLVYYKSNPLPKILSEMIHLFREAQKESF